MYNSINDMAVQYGAVIQTQTGHQVAQSLYFMASLIHQSIAIRW